MKTEDKFIIGLDIGGTKVEISLFKVSSEQEPDQKVGISFSTTELKNLVIENLLTTRIPTNRDEGYQVVLNRIADQIKKICSDSKIEVSSLYSIGIGLPGSVNPRTGVMLVGNSEIFKDKLIKKDLNKLLEAQLIINCNNDASCFALAEALAGAGQKFRIESGIEIKDQQSIGVILGTGCGGGLIHSGKILDGRFGGGGEIGHTTLISNGHECYCGRKGCAELYLSGPGIANNYKLDYPKETPLSASEIFKSNSKSAKESIQKYKENLLEFLTNISNFYDPDFIVLGGGMSKETEIYLGLEQELKKRIFLPIDAPKVYQHCLTDSAGTIGAAILSL